MELTKKQIALIITGVVFGILALTWIAQGNDFFLLRVFGAPMADARYHAFKDSQPYLDGLVKNMRQYQASYVQAGPEQRSALAGIILGSLGEGDEQKLPADLQVFVADLRRQQIAHNQGMHNESSH